MSQARRYCIKPLEDGIEVCVRAKTRVWKVVLWTAFHLPLAGAIPMLVVHECPYQVLVLFAIPIGFALGLYMMWTLWQLRGTERFVVTNGSWTYEASVGGVFMQTALKYHFDPLNKPRLVVEGQRLRFEGQLKMGYAFENEEEIRAFLADVSPYFDAKPKTEPTEATVVMNSMDELPIMDEVMDAMIPILDLLDRDDHADLRRLL